MVFPLDMLRYDHCIPATSEDVGKIIDSLSYERQIELEQSKDELVVTVSAYWEKPYKPKAERWQSFGWQVVDGSLETQKM
jgi:hypothetical protein